MPEATLLLTRPLAASLRFQRELGLPALISPVLEVRDLGPVDPGDARALILTSENGARAARGIALPAWVVGRRTAALWGEVAGMAEDADGLLRLLLAARPPGPLLHVRGVEGRDLAGPLRRAGLETRAVVAYEAAALPPSPEARALLDGSAPVLLPLFSPRSAALVRGWGGAAPREAVALSPAVAAAWGAPARIAARPDGAAMRAAVLEALGMAD